MKKGMIIFLILFSIPVFADYDNSLKLYQQGKFQESLNLVAEKLVIADDMVKKEENYKLRYLAAHIHWKLKNYKNALAHLKRCADIKANSVDPLIDIAFIYIEEKRLRDATSYIQKIFKKDKKNALAFFLFGKIKLHYKNYWGAKELFEKSLALNAELYQSWNALGKTLMYLKKYSRANTAFATAHAMKTDSAEILNNLAISYQLLKNKSDAMEAIKKALKIDPNNVKIIANKQIIETMKD